MKRLRIALDPELVNDYGPEVHWTWRYLLAGIGWAWEEVPLQADTDIVWTTHPEQTASSRLVIRANPRAWRQPSAYRLSEVGSESGLAYPRYLGEKQAQALVWMDNGRLLCQRDLAFDVFWLLTGQEEARYPRLRHGFLDLSGSPYLSERVLRQALASRIAAFLERSLADLGHQPPIPRWPGGNRAAAAVGHDVDYPQVIRWLEPLRILKRLGQRFARPAFEVLSGRRTHWHFASWMAYEAELGVRSAFYFASRKGSLLSYALGRPDPFYDVSRQNFRQVLHYLDSEGFEIGLHASYLAYRDGSWLMAEKQCLEEASGRSVAGVRHHYWHLDSNDPEHTLSLHERVGFKYDSSLIHDRCLGWRRGSTWPFYPFHQAERREMGTLQISIAWMDDQLFRLRSSNPGEPLEQLYGLADRVVEQGGCLLVDVHDYVYDEVLFPSWRATYRCLWEYLASLGGVWFATPFQIANHWSSRYTRLRKASHGLALGIH